jgi:hypothetical protein
MTLKCADNIMWTPQLQGKYDVAIMEFVTTIYSKKLATKINRCRLYLQVLTLYDVITYDGKQIHPNILMGQ